MQENRVERIIVFICSIIALGLSPLGILLGIGTLASGGMFSSLGFMTLVPGIMFFPVCLFDFLYLIRLNKNGYGFACFSNVYKIVLAIFSYIFMISVGGGGVPAAYIALGVWYLILLIVAVPSIYNQKRFKYNQSPIPPMN